MTDSRRRFRRALAVAALILAAPSGTAAQSTPQEYQLKAVFLFRFAQFADWPPSMFSAPDAPIVIGVLGKDPFGPYLDATVKGESVNGHPLVVRRFARAEDVKDCHIVFVNDQGKLDRVLADLASQHALTVGDVDGFARKGGMVGFVNEAGRLRLRVNLQVAETAGLKLSSNLLRPAEIVTTRKD